MGTAILIRGIGEGGIASGIYRVNRKTVWKPIVSRGCGGRRSYRADQNDCDKISAFLMHAVSI